MKPRIRGESHISRKLSVIVANLSSVSFSVSSPSGLLLTCCPIVLQCFLLCFTILVPFASQFWRCLRRWPLAQRFFSQPVYEEAQAFLRSPSTGSMHLQHVVLGSLRTSISLLMLPICSCTCLPHPLGLLAFSHIVVSNSVSDDPSILPHLIPTVVYCLSSALLLPPIVGHNAPVEGLL